MKQFTKLAIPNADNLVFGTAPYPVTVGNNLAMGNGIVYPELNFTVPPMEINNSTFQTIETMYRTIVEEACSRAVELHSRGLVIEFETLIEMTITPRYAVTLTRIISEVLHEAHEKTGLPTALRVTPNDIREKDRPPRMKNGPLLDAMFEVFDGCAQAGADMLSIESTGGKEIHDQALMMCDIEQVIFALSIMGCRDMAFLWQRIVEISEKHSVVPAGDTACGFGNTAMVLAEKKMIPRVFAAVVRAATISRSLVAYEAGAVGPGKDCGYENPYLKAITGYPMAMEGKTAACAHVSPLGNIAAATCDLWSNESVQNIRLLGGSAPIVYLEQLEYDCRLMNKAREHTTALVLRNLFVDSDAPLDPQAYILTPENVIRLAESVVTHDNPYQRTVASVKEALSIIKQGYENKQLKLPEMDIPWLSQIETVVNNLPDNEIDFIEQTLPKLNTNAFNAEDYNL